MKKLFSIILCAAAIQSVAADFPSKTNEKLLTVDLRQCHDQKSVFVIKPGTERDSFFEMKVGKNVQHISSIFSDGSAHAETTFDGSTLKISSFKVSDQDFSFDFQISNTKVSFEKGVDLIPWVRMPEVYTRNDHGKIILKKNIDHEALFERCIIKFNYK